MKITIAACLLLVVLMALAACLMEYSGYSLKYSPEHSIRTGFYLFRPCPAGPHRLNGLVLFDFNKPDMFQSAAFPSYRQLIKYIGGLGGATIHDQSQSVTVCTGQHCKTFQLIANVPRVNLPSVIPDGFFFAFGTSADSFDSRYFGLVPASAIKGCGA